MTVDEYIVIWLEEKSASCKPKTMEDYRRSAKAISNVLGCREMDDAIKARDIKSCYADALRQGHECTAYHIHKVCRMLFGAALCDEEITRSPAAAVKAPRYSPPEILPLNGEDIERLTGCGTWTAPLWSLLIDTGLRLGELAALSWKDIDYTLKRIKVEHNLSRVDGKTYIQSPKSGKSMREIPIPDTVCYMLKRYQQRQKEYALKSGSGWSERSYVASKDGVIARDPRDIYRALKRDIEKLGGLSVRCSPHVLRHTYGANAVKAGISIRVLQVLMGHADISTTAKYYTYVESCIRAEANAKISSISNASRCYFA